MRARRSVALVIACACGGPLVGDAGDAGSSPSSTTAASASSTSDGGSTSSSSSTTGDTTTGGTTETGDDADESAGSPFIIVPDASGTMMQCDIFAEDCPTGFKCMPWANDGGSAWNATKCSPIAPDPKDPGEPCTLVGSFFSGEDDCDIHTMCWEVDPETNMGTCVAMCSGTAARPVCEVPCTRCVIGGEGVLALCLPTCDPMAQDCAEGRACYPAGLDFGCYPEYSGPDAGGVGDPCDESWYDCDPGLFCADADTVPGCASAYGCCTPFCNPEIAESCPASLVGAECVPWDEFLGPCYPTPVGGCVLP